MAALPIVYSTVDYCTPVWCRSTHTCLLDSAFDDVLRIVTTCLRLIPTDHLVELYVIIVHVLLLRCVKDF